MTLSYYSINNLLIYLMEPSRLSFCLTPTNLLMPLSHLQCSPPSSKSHRRVCLSMHVHKRLCLCTSGVNIPAVRLLSQDLSARRMWDENISYSFWGCCCCLCKRKEGKKVPPSPAERPPEAPVPRGCATERESCALTGVHRVPLGCNICNLTHWADYLARRIQCSAAVSDDRHRFIHW